VVSTNLYATAKRLTSISSDVIILAILSLLIAAAIFYLPNHIVIVSNRLWYYVHGEFLYANNGGNASAAAVAGDVKEEIRRLVTDAVTSGRGAESTAESIARGIGDL
jgi:hypothetical protein